MRRLSKTTELIGRSEAEIVAGSVANADAVGRRLQRFVGRVVTLRVRESLKWHVPLDFSIRSGLPHSHIQHFAPKRVEEV